MPLCVLAGGNTGLCLGKIMLRLFKGVERNLLVGQAVCEECVVVEQADLGHDGSEAPGSAENTGGGGVWMALFTF